MNHKIENGKHVLTLTEEEMNTVVLAVGYAPVETIKGRAKFDGLKILECDTSNFGLRELDKFYSDLRSIIR